MKKILLAIAIGSLMIVGILTLLPTTNALRDDQTEFVHWSDLTPGQKGYGLTVLEGDTPERFEVEFVSAIPNEYFPEEKAILVRLGKPLENGNVIQGMSGSPIYFFHGGKWKLAGALAFGYRLPAGSKAVAGVTPIHLMIRQERILRMETSQKLEPKPLNPAEQTRRKTISPRLRPGDSIAVRLIDGDCPQYAVGTVTYVEGNKFWAFGHALFGDGKIILPISKARIATSLQSSAPGFKITAELKEPVGYITYDNIFGAEGEIGDLPKNTMLPVNLTFSLAENGTIRKAEFHFQVVRNKLYTSDLIADAISKLLENLWNKNSEGAATSMTVIGFSDRPPLTVTDTLAVRGTVNLGLFSIVSGPWLAARKPITMVDALLNSQWDFGIDNLSIRIDAKIGKRILNPVYCQFVDKNRNIAESVRPGQTIRLVLGLRSSDGKEHFVTTLPIKIPNDLVFEKSGEQPLFVYIESGNLFEERDARKILDRPPQNPEEFLQVLLRDERPPQKIYVQLVFPPAKTGQRSIRLPVVTEREWSKVKNFDSLRKATATEQRILVRELASPLPDFILNIDVEETLKILPWPPKTN